MTQSTINRPRIFANPPKSKQYSTQWVELHTSTESFVLDAATIKSFIPVLKWLTDPNPKPGAADPTYDPKLNEKFAKCIRFPKDDPNDKYFCFRYSNDLLIPFSTIDKWFEAIFRFHKHSLTEFENAQGLLYCKNLLNGMYYTMPQSSSLFLFESSRIPDRVAPLLAACFVARFVFQLRYRIINESCHFPFQQPPQSHRPALISKSFGHIPFSKQAIQMALNHFGSDIKWAHQYPQPRAMYKRGSHVQYPSTRMQVQDNLVSDSLDYSTNLPDPENYSLLYEIMLASKSELFFIDKRSHDYFYSEEAKLLEPLTEQEMTKISSSLNTSSHMGSNIWSGSAPLQPSLDQWGFIFQHNNEFKYKSPETETTSGSVPGSGDRYPFSKIPFIPLPTPSSIFYAHSSVNDLLAPLGSSLCLYAADRFELSCSSIIKPKPNHPQCSFYGNEISLSIQASRGTVVAKQQLSIDLDTTYPKLHPYYLMFSLFRTQIELDMSLWNNVINVDTNLLKIPSPVSPKDNNALMTFFQPAADNALSSYQFSQRFKTNFQAIASTTDLQSFVSSDGTIPCLELQREPLSQRWEAKTATKKLSELPSSKWWIQRRNDTKKFSYAATDDQIKKLLGKSRYAFLTTLFEE